MKMFLVFPGMWFVTMLIVLTFILCFSQGKDDKDLIKKLKLAIKLGAGITAFWVLSGFVYYNYF